MTAPDAELARPLRDAAWRPGLFVAGVLLFFAPFLYANPFNGYHVRAWPWDVWIESASWDARTEMIGIALAAVGAIATGLGAGRIRSLFVVATLATLFAIRLHGEAATFSLLAVERLGLSWFASGVVLGVGLLVLSRRDGRARRVGVRLSVLGSIWTITFLVAWFPRDTAALGGSMLEYYVHRVADFWDALVRHGEADESARDAITPMAWSQVVPTVFLGLSVLLGLLSVLCSGLKRIGLSRGVAVAGFIAYLCTWLIPLGSALVLSADTSRDGVVGPIGTIGNALLDAGLALWLVLAFSIAAIVRELDDPERERHSRGALEPVPAERWLFVLVFALGAISLMAHFHPRAGLAAHAWPTEVLRRFQWNAAGSALAFHFLLIALALGAATTRPAPGTTWFLVAGFGAVLIALEGPVRDETEIRRFLFRAPPYAPFLLAAIAAGAGASISVIRTNRWSRAIASAAGIGILVILLYPIAAPVLRQDSIAPTGVDRYVSVLSTGWSWAERPVEFLLGFEPRFGCPMTATLLSLAGVLAIAAGVRRPGPVRRAALWTTFAAASAWPLIQLVGGAMYDGADQGVPFAIRASTVFLDTDLPHRCAAAVSFFYLPLAWAAAAVVRRASRSDEATVRAN